MRRILFALLLVPGLATAQTEPDDALQKVFRALSVRHSAPSCADVEALTPTPVKTLLSLVEEVESPPWVPMRAAECLTRRHHAEIAPQLDRWVTEAELRGLGLLVVGLLDELPEETGRTLATRALKDGPDPERVRARLLRSERPSLRALAEQVTP